MENVPLQWLGGKFASFWAVIVLWHAAGAIHTSLLSPSLGVPAMAMLINSQQLDNLSANQHVEFHISLLQFKGDLSLQPTPTPSLTLQQNFYAIFVRSPNPH